MFKAILDSIMTVLLVLMFDKMVLGLKFHEIGGLVVVALFLVHLIGNWKWVVGVSKNLFSTNTPIKTKVNYIVNFLLFFNMILILVTGILISKIVFKGFDLPNVGIAKFLHFFSGGLFIILVGVHIGLHWEWIVAIFKKIFKIPPTFKLNKVVSIVAVIFILALGGVSMANSKFPMWIKAPFVYQNMQNKPDNEQNSHTDEEGKNADRTNQKGEQKGEMQKHHQEGGARDTEGINIIEVITTGFKFISIISIFSVIAYYLKKFLLK